MTVETSEDRQARAERTAQMESDAHREYVEAEAKRKEREKEFAAQAVQAWMLENPGKDYRGDPDAGAWITEKFSELKEASTKVTEEPVVSQDVRSISEVVERIEVCLSDAGFTLHQVNGPMQGFYQITINEE